MHRAYPNVWVNMPGPGEDYNPLIEHEDLREIKSLLVKACHASDEGHNGESRPSNSTFGSLSNPNDRMTTLSTIFGFMGTFPTIPPISALICLFPPNLPPINPETLISYEQYLIRNVQPVCGVYMSASKVGLPPASFWVVMALPMQSSKSSAYQAPSATATSSEESGDTEYCCERIFDVLSSSSADGRGVRPKEQLRLDSAYFPSTILLLSRYRAKSTPGKLSASPSSSETTPGLSGPFQGFDDATIQQAFASLYVPPPSQPMEQPPPLSDREIRDAAMSVLNAYSSRSIGGPMAPTLCAIAEGILINTPLVPETAEQDLVPPPGFPAAPPSEASRYSSTETRSLSSLLNLNDPTSAVPSARRSGSTMDAQLLFDLQQAQQRRSPSVFVPGAKQHK